VAAADVVLGAVNTASSATTIRNTQALNSAKAIVGLVTTSIAGPATAGVQGQSNAANGNGLFGVSGPGAAAKGAWGRSAAGIGVFGEAMATSGVNYGVRGVTPSTSGTGVQGVANATSGATYGVFGSSASPAGRGVYGFNTAIDGVGVSGVANNGVAKGVYGRSSSGYGVYGEATGVGGTGVHGEASNGVQARGVEGVSTGRGVFGASTGTSVYSSGVYGSGRIGVEAFGSGTSGTAIYAHSEHQGVIVEADALGIYAEGGTIGVDARGVATAVNAAGGATGVYAEGSQYGIYARKWSGQLGAAVYANGIQAGYFLGNVFVEGTLGKSGGSFVIDHPQDPANKILEHSFVEAPQRLNVYDGTVTLDATGAATVRMPRYFRALNRDFRYQLTAIGTMAPGLHISKEIERSGFTIAGGAPGQKVCWQVTGVRQDAWAQKHPLRVERAKRRKDRGKYLNPDAFGKPRSAAMHPAPKVPRMQRTRRIRPAA
jgi:hypothetical protein